MSLWELIELYMYRRGITQDELAMMSNVSPRTIYNLKNGTIDVPHFATLCRLAGVLGIDINEFKPLVTVNGGTEPSMKCHY